MGRALKLLFAVLCLIVLLFFFSLSVPLDTLQSFIASNTFLSASIFVALMFVATVLAPLSVLPLVPAAAPVFGPFVTALYAILGWWMGALVAFLIARVGGKPLLKKFISLDEIARYEKKIPQHMTLWWLVLLRMMIPVDVLSYVIGAVSSVPFGIYAIASLIGVTPFAFIFSYGGSTLLGTNYIGFALVLGAGAVLFLSVIYFFYRYQSKAGCGGDGVERAGRT